MKRSEATVVYLDVCSIICMVQGLLAQSGGGNAGWLTRMRTGLPMILVL